jgi:hypothetical protein
LKFSSLGNRFTINFLDIYKRNLDQLTGHLALIVGILKVTILE